MNASCRSPLLIGAVCAAAIGGVMLATCTAQTTRTLREFHGVTPGESRIDSLGAGEWKQLVSQSTAADGTRHLEFRIAPWKKVVVVARGDRVIGIDLFPPQDVPLQDVCKAFGLGQVMPAGQLPPEARFTTEGIAGTLYESPAAFALIEMEHRDGLQQVRRLRLFGDRPLSAGGTAEGGRPAPAEQPDPSGQPPASLAVAGVIQAVPSAPAIEPDLSGRPPAAVAPFPAQQTQSHQERLLKQFLGVTPGTTSEAELRANPGWGQPLAVALPPQPEGRSRLVYKIQPWEQVAVMIEAGVVRTIDLVPPAVYLELDAFANALKLGPLIPLAALPAGAEAGGPPALGWRLLEPSDVYIVLFVEQVGDKQHVKWMRTYAPGRRPPSPPPMAIAPFNAPQARVYQEAWAKYLGQPVEMTNGVGMKLTLIPPGEFVMGSTVSAAEIHRRFPGGQIEWYEREHPSHKVRITRPYYLGTHEVSVEDFQRFVTATGYKTTAEKIGRSWGRKDREWKDLEGLNWRQPGFDQQSTHPVTCVSWDDAVAFCQWLSREEGRTYRLPTEAEWEYSCRAGTDKLFFWGDDPDAGEGYLNAADQTGIPEGGTWAHKFNFKDGYAATSPVGRFKPNAFGLQDMLGNVWEWCSDWYGGYASTAVDDPTGPTAGSSRVLRGGGWEYSARSCRSASRNWGTPDARAISIGFRLAFSLVDQSGR